MRWGMVVAVVAVAMLCSGCGESSLTLADRAGQAYDAQDYDLAISCATEGIRLAGRGEAQCYRVRGLAKAMKGDNAAGIKDMTDAIRVAPNEWQGYNNRSMIYCWMKDYPRAVADADQAIRLNPRVPQPYRNRATARTEGSRQFAKAIEDVNAAYKLDPPKAGEGKQDLAAIYRAMAEDALDKLRPYDGIGFCDKAIVADPKYPIAYAVKAKCWESVQQFKDARDCYLQAANLMPDNLRGPIRAMADIMDRKVKAGER